MSEKGFVLPIIAFVVIIIGVGLYVASSEGLLNIPGLTKLKKSTSTDLPKVELKSDYQNPFETKTQYTNPFASYKNPFDSLKQE